MSEFIAFPKIARYSREVIVTEKIDGTNSQIFITEDGEFFTGSKNRWITPESKVTDNFGFSKWAHEHKDELMELGPGRHFGEWWGRGIQRGYGIMERRFSLFNVTRWQENRPACCDIVPVIWRGNFDDLNVEQIMADLWESGSHAESGFMNPEGIVIFHVAAGIGFKKTYEKDSTGKWDS